MENSKDAKTYTPPQGSEKKLEFTNRENQKLSFTAKTDWMVLRKNEKPIAEMFYTFYSRESAQPRPITFVFNGGPGAASAYLHVGGLGPLRIQMDEKGNALPPPTQLVNNEDSWLEFTDLVFIDPIGTGFSRPLDEIDKTQPFAEKKEEKPHKPKKEFYQLEKDLESLSEFIVQFLSVHKRWSAPKFIAGESYGGFRVARLTRKLQEEYGVGLNGAILISPCMEWAALNHNDYDVLFWSELYPSLVMASIYHGKSKTFDYSMNLNEVRKKVELFATTELLPCLASGESMDLGEREKVWKTVSEDLGLPMDLVNHNEGRINYIKYCRNLFKNENLWCGLYDASVLSIDPFPNRDMFEGPDPTLASIERVFCSGINSLFRESLEVKIERDYKLLNFDVNTSWKVDSQSHAFERYVSSVDDIRFAMSLNPFMNVTIVHGLYDLITPYFSSGRLVNLMRLDPRVKNNMSTQLYPGGHMFYSWEESRKAFFDNMQTFVRASIKEKTHVKGKTKSDGDVRS